MTTSSRYGYTVIATHPTTGETSKFWYCTELVESARRFMRQLETDGAHQVEMRVATPDEATGGIHA